MAKNANQELTQVLRKRGVRKKLAKQIGKLDGNASPWCFG